MLENIIRELIDNFGYDFNKIDKDKYQINISDDIQINVTKIDEEIYFHSPIIKCPTDKKEQIYTYLMKANLLGQGTGKGSIGMDKDEKFLTLSYVMAYEDNYITFKEKTEDFINYLLYWEEEINKLKQQESIF